MKSLKPFILHLRYRKFFNVANYVRDLLCKALYDMCDDICEVCAAKCEKMSIMNLCK